MNAADFKSWKQGFYLPTKSDGGVFVLRRWLDSKAGGGVQWGPNVYSSNNREAAVIRESLFDNYHQHTKDCPHCSKAMNNIKKLQAVVSAIGAALFLGYAALLGQGTKMMSRQSLMFAGSIVVCVLVRRALSSLLTQFMTTDWRHAENSKW